MLQIGVSRYKFGIFKYTLICFHTLIRFEITMLPLIFFISILMGLLSRADNEVLLQEASSIANHSGLSPNSTEAIFLHHTKVFKFAAQ